MRRRESIDDDVPFVLFLITFFKLHIKKFYLYYFNYLYFPNRIVPDELSEVVLVLEWLIEPTLGQINVSVVLMTIGVNILIVHTHGIRPQLALARTPQ
jgi:hypothetical protein